MPLPEQADARSHHGVRAERLLMRCSRLNCAVRIVSHEHELTCCLSRRAPAWIPLRSRASSGFRGLRLLIRLGLALCLGRFLDLVVRDFFTLGLVVRDFFIFLRRRPGFDSGVKDLSVLGLGLFFLLGIVRLLVVVLLAFRFLL